MKKSKMKFNKSTIIGKFTPIDSIKLENYKIKTISTSLSKKQFIVYTLLFMPIIISIVSGIHETGHGLAVLMFGGKIYKIVVFPYSLLIDNPLSTMGYITWGGSFTVNQKIIVYMAGTVMTFIMSIVILFLSVSKQRNPLVELFGYWAVIMLSIDCLYPIIDLITFNFDLSSIPWMTDTSGDWYKIYNYIPWMRYIAPLIGITWLVFMFFLFEHRKIEKYFEF